MLSHHLLSLRTHPSGENQEPPTHKRKGSSRNAVPERYSSPSGPVRGSVSFRDSDALHKARVLQCSVAEGERNTVPRSSILARKGCSAHHLPQSLADHQDGPGAPLLMQAGFTTAYTQVRQSTTEKALLSIQHSRKTHQQVLLFFFVFATLLDPYQGLNPVPPALVVRGLNHCPAGEVLSLALNTSQGYQEAGQGRSEPSQPFFVNQPGSTGREDEVLSHDACILIFGLYPVQEPGPHSLSPCPRPGSQEPSGGRGSMEPVLGPQAVPQLGHQQAETALGL